MAEFGGGITTQDFTEDGFMHDVVVELSYEKSVNNTRICKLQGGSYSGAVELEGGTWVAGSDGVYRKSGTFSGIKEPGDYALTVYDKVNQTSFDTLGGKTSLSVADDGWTPQTETTISATKQKTDSNCAISVEFKYTPGGFQEGSVWTRRFDLVKQDGTTADTVTTNDWSTGAPAVLSATLHATEAGQYLVKVVDLSEGAYGVVSSRILVVVDDDDLPENPQPEPEPEPEPTPTPSGRLYIRGFQASRLIYDEKNTVYNSGDVPTTFKIVCEFDGHVSRPKFIKDDKFVLLEDGFEQGDVLEIDFTAAPPTVRKNGKNTIQTCSRDSNFVGMGMQVGANVFNYTCDNSDTNRAYMNVRVLFYKKYLGV